MASSMALPISGVCAAAAMVFQRALLGNEEDVLTRVFVAVLLEALALLNEFLVFWSNLSEMYFRKMRPSTTFLYSEAVDVAAQLVGSAPDLFLEADLGGIVLLLCHVLYYPPARPIR